MKNLNFFSPYINEKIALKNKILYILISIVTIIIIMLGLYLWNLNTINKLETELADMDRFLSSKDTIEKLAQINEIKRKTELLKQYNGILIQVNNQIAKIDKIKTSLLEDISKSIPQNTYIQVLSFSTKEINLEGISESRQAIAEFQHNLNQLGIIDNAYIVSITEQFDEKNYYIFTARCKFKDVSIDAN